jgi:hypothetical protein
MTPSVVRAAAPKVGDPLAFYTVAATIIPVLFIAAVFEARFLEPPPHRRDKNPERTIDLTDLLTGVVLLGFGILGEAASLEVLSTRRPSTHGHAAAVLALIVLAFGVIATPVTSAIRPIAETTHVILAILLVVLVLGILFGAGELGSSMAR